MEARTFQNVKGPGAGVACAGPNMHELIKVFYVDPHRTMADAAIVIVFGAFIEDAFVWFKLEGVILKYNIDCSANIHLQPECKDWASRNNPRNVLEH
ncbi:hypothetical protein TSUD_157920 [Trifolium subterraneum]|uniref:Uncharacterized protein n=1 Tax=Trifolium subterraneum TaxID=3900 RepID=A0A2Z6MQN6_TRISU|nr:hypothetical protein TSUD_157920 [Trifolium subterraneum]